MEYILNAETDGIDFDRYSAYVESIRTRLPSHVYAFASNPCYFDLNSRSSLHDAWLEDLTAEKRRVVSGIKSVVWKSISACLATIMIVGFISPTPESPSIRLLRLQNTGSRCMSTSPRATC